MWGRGQPSPGMCYWGGQSASAVSVSCVYRISLHSSVSQMVGCATCNLKKQKDDKITSSTPPPPPCKDTEGPEAEAPPPVVTAFATPDSFLQYTAMSFGLRNGPATSLCVYQERRPTGVLCCKLLFG